MILQDLRLERVWHLLITWRTTPQGVVDFQKLGVRIGKAGSVAFSFLLRIVDVALFVGFQHTKSLFMRPAMEVFLALGLHDLGVADDASVRRIGVVHRLRFGRGSGLALWWVIQLEQNIKLRRGAGVDRSLGLLLDLLGRGVDIGWRVVLGQFVGLGLDFTWTGGEVSTKQGRGGGLGRGAGFGRGFGRHIGFELGLDLLQGRGGGAGRSCGLG